MQRRRERSAEPSRCQFARRVLRPLAGRQHIQQAIASRQTGKRQTVDGKFNSRHAAPLRPAARCRDASLRTTTTKPACAARTRQGKTTNRYGARRHRRATSTLPPQQRGPPLTERPWQDTATLVVATVPCLTRRTAANLTPGKRQAAAGSLRRVHTHGRTPVQLPPALACTRPRSNSTPARSSRRTTTRSRPQPFHPPRRQNYRVGPSTQRTAPIKPTTPTSSEQPSAGSHSRILKHHKILQTPVTLNRKRTYEKSHACRFYT